MFGSSSSSSTDKSPVIHSNVNETIVHTYSSVLDLVNEKIFNRFRKTLGKTPVVLVESQIPPDVLDWYKTYVFGQTKDKVEELTNGTSKETKSKETESKESESKETKLKESKPVETEAKKAEFKEPIKSKEKNADPKKDFVVEVTKLDGDVNVFKDDSMDIEEAEEALETPFNIETDQQNLPLPDEILKQTIDDLMVDKNDEDDNDNVNDEMGSEFIVTMDESKLDSNETKEIDQMDLVVEDETVNQPIEETISKPTIDQPSKPRVESNLQLSEESSNESTSSEKNEEILEDLITNILSSIVDTNLKNKEMEIESTQEEEKKDQEDKEIKEIDESKEIKENEENKEEAEEEVAEEAEEDEPSQLESNQSDNQSFEEPSKPNIKESGLELSEESSNDSTEMDKKDNENNEKMQNIKFNSNVFSEIEDENNLLDFEDI